MKKLSEQERIGVFSEHLSVSLSLWRLKVGHFSPRTLFWLSLLPKAGLQNLLTLVRQLMTHSTPIQCINCIPLFYFFLTKLKHFTTLQKFPMPWMVLFNYFLSAFLCGSRGIRSISLFLTIQSSFMLSSPEIFLQAKKCHSNAYFFILLRSFESKA